MVRALVGPGGEERIRTGAAQRSLHLTLAACWFYNVIELNTKYHNQFSLLPGWVNNGETVPSASWTSPMAGFGCCFCWNGAVFWLWPKALKGVWASRFCGALPSQTQQLWWILVRASLAHLYSVIFVWIRGVWWGVFVWVCSDLFKTVFSWYSWRAVSAQNDATDERKPQRRRCTPYQSCAIPPCWPSPLLGNKIKSQIMPLSLYPLVF